MKKKVFLSLIEGQSIKSGLLNGVEFDELYINYRERLSDLEEDVTTKEAPLTEPFGKEIALGVVAYWFGDLRDHKPEILQLIDMGIVEWYVGQRRITKNKVAPDYLGSFRGNAYLIGTLRDGVYLYHMLKADEFKDLYGAAGVHLVKGEF